MTDVSMSPVVHHDIETCAGGGRAASGAADRRRAHVRRHGAVDGLIQRPAGHALHGDAKLIADERNDADVSADEPRSAVAETDL